MANGIIIFRQNEKKARRALRHIEKAKAYEFAEIVKRTYRTNPHEKDLQELRKWLDEYPEMWTLVFDMAQVIEQNLIERIVPQKAAHLALEKNVAEIRHSLGYEEATTMEMMLIDNLVLTLLRCQWAEYQLVVAMGQDGIRMSVIQFWERRLTAAQGRYLRACETLAKIRKLSLKNPALQVNIATQGGQQVNIAGDVIKK